MRLRLQHATRKISLCEVNSFDRLDGHSLTCCSFLLFHHNSAYKARIVHLHMEILLCESLLGGRKK